MSSILDKARGHFKEKLPFVMYCKPGAEVVIGLFQKNDSLYLLSDEYSGFAFVSFDNEKRYMIPDAFSDIYYEKTSGIDFYVLNENDSNFSNSDKNEFEELVEKAVIEIEKGTFEKVVLSRKELVASSNFEFDVLFSKLLVAYLRAFRYVLYHPELGFWMGATPEQLIKVEGDLLSTVSLAGTQLNKEGADIIWNEKEKQEQQIVTDYIVSNLKPFSKQIDVDEPKTVKAGNLVHIKSDIRAQIELENLDKIIEALHPTPAVCGFPKEAALQFIVENEGYDRSFYAGFLGEWKKDFKTFKENQFDLYVNLRCMSYVNQELHIYVGCGITKGSVPEKEYFETANKAMTMKRIV